jgi:inosine-uridine nucleoside N-ribohydrolase
LCTPEVLDQIVMIDSKFSRLIIELLLFFKNSNKELFDLDHPPLHDPCAVAFVINPNIFEYKLLRVDVETASPLTYGRTVVDIYNMSVKPKNVFVCTKMCVDSFWRLFIDAINKADKQSPLNK